MDAQQIIEQLADFLGRRVELVPSGSDGAATPGADALDRYRGLVPIDLGGRTPYLRYDVEGRAPLTARDYDALGGAIDLLRLTPTAHSASWLSTREALLLRILTAEPGTAGVDSDAMSRARMERWIDPRGTLTVHALLFDGRLSDLERFVFVRSMASSIRAHGVFAGIRDGVAYVMTGRGRDREDVRSWIVREATDRRVGLIAVGSADVDRRSDDVFAPAQKARIAAGISASPGTEQKTGRSADPSLNHN